MKTTIRDEIERNYRLILIDDTVHTIQQVYKLQYLMCIVAELTPSVQVCKIITECCPLCPGPRAYEVTLETHMSGQATICVANKKIVEEVLFYFVAFPHALFTFGK